VRFAALVPVVALALVACSSGEEAAPSPAPTDTAAEEAPPPTEPEATPGRAATVAEVIDGDTLALANGQRVRLVQIDTPELTEGECYARASARALAGMLPPGASVGLEADPGLDRVDRYGRLLRYVHRSGTNVNLALVRRGAASVWFFEGDRGRYADRLLAAARRAKAARQGLWGVCPGTRLDPEEGVDTSARPAKTSGGRCDPSYPGICIPPPPPDLDCADVPYRDFRVVGRDPHHFDGGGDGIGCESER
jgi:micrococcal nuclease